MTAGRPTEYYAEAVAHGLAEYVANAKSQTYLPTVEELAVHLCVSGKTLYDRADPERVTVTTKNFLTSLSS